MEFKLSEKQQEELKVWQGRIKDLYDQYGTYDYIFTPFGMGTGVKVFSHLTKTVLDLTHEENW
jgi:hypothetical protein